MDELLPKVWKRAESNERTFLSKGDPGQRSQVERVDAENNIEAKFGSSAVCKNPLGSSNVMGCKQRRF